MQIGAYQVVHSTTFLCGEGQNVAFKAKVGTAIVSFALLFVHDPALGEGGLSWSASGNELRLTFSNWRHTIGAALVQPIRVGDVDGLPLSVQAAAYRVGDVNVVHFQVMTGGQ
jgi:hypothetical protein